MTRLQNLTSAGVDRGNKVSSSNSSVTDVCDFKPEFNSLKSLKELLVSSNSDGMKDGEDLLEVLFTVSKNFSHRCLLNLIFLYTCQWKGHLQTTDSKSDTQIA